MKRFYLLFSVIFALIIPLITLTYQIEVVAEPQLIQETVNPMTIGSTTKIIEEPTNYLPIFLWSIYGIGVLVFGIRFMRNIYDISKKIRANERLIESSHINVLLSSAIVPHTFLKYIFVSKKEFKQRNIPEEVLLHEKTHVAQKHTLDILFVEVLQVFFWFNPVFILIKRSVKLNHEFLADQNVLKQQCSIQNYFDLLLNYPNSLNQAVLSSPINYSLTKKRLQMMTKEFSKSRTALKIAALVPILLLCILSFNNEIIAREVALPVEEITAPVETNPSIEEPSIMVLKGEKKEEDDYLNAIKDNFQDGVTTEMLKEYNQWAKNINKRIKSNQSVIIQKNELDRMEYIYKNMTPEQRKGVEQFPNIPPPPPAPKAPKVKKGEKSNIPPPPPPPPPAPEAPKVKKGEKSSIPPPPPPPNNEEGSSIHKGNYAEVRFSEKSNLSDEEKEAYIERVEATLARERAEIERERAEIERERANIQREESRLLAEEARMEKEIAAGTARRSAEESREVAEKARAIAREARHKARERSEKEMKKAELQSRKAEKQRRKAEMDVRKIALKAEMEARVAMRKAEMQAHKAERAAKKIALEAEMQARKAERQAMRMEKNHSPEKLIESMAKKDAEFYYNGKQISAKKALKLVEGSDTKFSIDASTKNGKSKVIIKD
ncbi:M56 family metallopeptidase [Aquimarina sp. 2201CG14-23]|uniref:M56 family metallopeptidase n=1 Tax=Aquimarina mycalae TaxID=3040073 RepID=UPI002478247D|nr:M56 family metallopeptidase [Aquimarina sp. 2201CG14-23]